MREKKTSEKKSLKIHPTVFMERTTQVTQCMLVACCLLLVACCLLLVACCLLLIACCLLVVACCLLLVGCCLLLVACCLLLVACCLFFGCWMLLVACCKGLCCLVRLCLLLVICFEKDAEHHNEILVYPYIPCTVCGMRAVCGQYSIQYRNLCRLQ
jgi:hypothetical protein